MDIKLYNSLSRSIEIFKPINLDEVGLYTCGPTVYNYPHIGNYRALLFADILKRVLKYESYNVKHIMNITDIDDKTIHNSQQEGKSLKEFTEFYTAEFYKDRDMLNIIPADTYTKATEYIDEMVTLIEKLITKGFAYTSDDGSTYFNIAKDPEYGKLTHLEKDELKSNAQGRIKTDEYDKENVQDFALWKAWDPSDGDVFWDTNLGKGHPGWHIECSAMSMKNLGEHFDIHTGGKDNMFPHHENEIAQSECATGTKFVNYWLHNEWLLVDGKKMSKSAGNFYTLRDIEEKGFSPLSYRYLTLLAHYRTPLNFTWDSLQAAKNALNKLQAIALNLKKYEVGKIDLAYKAKFNEAITNDLNMPEALGILWELLKDTEITPSDKRATLYDFDKVLGLGLSDIEPIDIPHEINILIQTREEARKNKNWESADQAREQIESLGYMVNDTPEGPIAFKK